jgi:hypothetical protein
MRILKQHIGGNIIWKDKSPAGLPRWVVTRNMRTIESTRIFSAIWFTFEQVSNIILAESYKGE